MSDQLLLPPSRDCATQSESGPGLNVPAPLLDVAGLDAAVIAELRDLADGNEAFVQEVLSAYFEQANEIMDAMRAALNAKDARSFRSGAHALGGSSLQVGAARVATICHAIQSSEDDAPAPLAAALETLASELHRVDASVGSRRDLRARTMSFSRETR